MRYLKGGCWPAPPLQGASSIYLKSATFPNIPKDDDDLLTVTCSSQTGGGEIILIVTIAGYRSDAPAVICAV